MSPVERKIIRSNVGPAAEPRLCVRVVLALLRGLLDRCAALTGRCDLLAGASFPVAGLASCGVRVPILSERDFLARIATGGDCADATQAKHNSRACA